MENEEQKLPKKQEAGKEDTKEKVKDEVVQENDDKKEKKEPQNNESNPLVDDKTEKLIDKGNKKNKYEHLPEFSDISRLEIIEYSVKKEVKRAIIKWVLFYGSIIILFLAFFGWTTYSGLEKGMKAIQSRLLKKAEKKLTTKITELYDENKITSVVDKIIRIDAKKIIKDNTIEIMNPIIDDVQEKQKKISSILTESLEEQKTIRDTTEEMKTINYFTTVLLSAQSDNRKAFEQLEVWSNDKTYPFSEIAGNAYVKIRLSYLVAVKRACLIYDWPEGIDPDKITFNEFKDAFSHINSIYHSDLVATLWDRSDISKKQKMEFFIDVLKKSNSLSGMNYAAGYFIKAAKTEDLKWDPFKCEPLLEWWDVHNNEIK